MREDASLWSKIVFGYAKPLLDSSLIQQIRFEQYGELPERLKICHEAKLLEEYIVEVGQSIVSKREQMISDNGGKDNPNDPAFVESLLGCRSSG